MGEPHGSVVELLDQRAPVRARLQVELRRGAGRPNRARRARPSWSASGRADTRADDRSGERRGRRRLRGRQLGEQERVAAAASTRASTRSGGAEPRRLRTNLVAEPGLSGSTTRTVEPSIGTCQRLVRSIGTRPTSSRSTSDAHRVGPVQVLDEQGAIVELVGHTHRHVVRLADQTDPECMFERSVHPIRHRREALPDDERLLGRHGSDHRGLADAGRPDELRRGATRRARVAELRDERCSSQNCLPHGRSAWHWWAGRRTRSCG